MKCALAYEELVLISSANLTSHALELNIELGILLRDAVLGAQLTGHFDALIQQGILQNYFP
jgi:phosphatidylserine/phosphatidylglycerophosphate/cardiolipin synthase-like enzyme